LFVVKGFGIVRARFCRRSEANALIRLPQFSVAALGPSQLAHVIIRRAVAAAYRVHLHGTYSCLRAACRTSVAIALEHLPQILVAASPGPSQLARVTVRRAVVAAYRVYLLGTILKAVLQPTHSGAPHIIMRSLLSVIVVLSRQSCRGEPLRETEDGY